MVAGEKPATIKNWRQWAMTKETRGNIAVYSAVGMLAFGMILTAIGFFVEPLGEVSDSVLWILGQALIYAGSIFGIATYTKGVIIKQVGELEERYRTKKKEESNE